MALFLSEAVNNYERKQVTRGSTNLTEAALMLLNISEQSASLTEAVMTAEFTLMRQCRNLSEGETSNKMKDFGKKVWHNLKAFAKTVWAKIKEICRMVWRKLKEWGSNVLDMFSGKEMEIPKRDLKYLEEAPRLIEKLLFLAEKGITASDDAADDLHDKAKELEKDFEELKKSAEKEEKFHENYYYGGGRRSLSEGFENKEDQEEFIELLKVRTEDMTEEQLKKYHNLYLIWISQSGDGPSYDFISKQPFGQTNKSLFDNKVKEVEARLKPNSSGSKPGSSGSATTHTLLREKGLVKVGKNWLKSVQSTISGYASKLEKLAEKMDKKVEEMEKLEGRMSHEDNQKDMGKAAQSLKTAIDIIKRLSTAIVEITNKITKVGRSVGKNEPSVSGLAKYLQDKFKIDETRLKGALQSGNVSEIIDAIENSQEKENEKDRAKDRVNAALERIKHFGGEDYKR